MKTIRLCAVALACGGAWAGCATAQTLSGWSLEYYSRDTYFDFDYGDYRDSDVVRLGYYVGQQTGERVIYGALSLGAQNEYFEDFYAHAQIEGGLYWIEDWGRHGGYARATFTDQFGEAVEAGYGMEYWQRNLTWRALLAVQDFDAPTVDDEEAELFALGEVTWYPQDWLSVRAGLLYQDDLPLTVIGVEMLPGRQSAFSVYVDWTVAQSDDYRGYGTFYNDLGFGVRLSMQGGTLMARDRVRPTRLFQRTIDPY